jgi:hypothetical protein
MEVHHHSHSGHGKKTWKSYFWEFLMLFLAVFCGFLAEYQLEHKIEHDREKTYIHSMIEDLQKDTSNLRISLESFKKQENNIDTVLALFPELTNGYNHTLRSNLNAIIGYKDFFATDRTLQQLKSSGNMRLIRNKNAADGIMFYDAKLKEHEKSLTTLDDVFFKFYDLYSQIQDNSTLDLDKKTMPLESIEKGNKNYLLVSDKATLGLFYNRIKSHRLLRQIVIRRMETLSKSANELIATLKKEYDIE